jgi:hypothetical protein
VHAGNSRFRFRQCSLFVGSTRSAEALVVMASTCSCCAEAQFSAAGKAQRLLQALEDYTARESESAGEILRCQGGRVSLVERGKKSRDDSRLCRLDSLRHEEIK